MNDRVVKRVPAPDLHQAALTAQEGFVLSRVDGDTTVEVLCSITGLGDAATLAALDALEQKGLVVVDSPHAAVGGSAGAEVPPVAAPEAPVSQAEPEAVGDGASGNDDGQQAPPLDGVSGSESVSLDAALSSTGAELDDESIEALLDQDERNGIDLKRKFRGRILRFRAQLRALTFFELLDVPVSANAKAVRRAYFRCSKEFHPDRYYTKNLGPYKDMLAEIFRQVQGAYEFLLDDAKREAYRATVEQQRQEDELSDQLAQSTSEALLAAGFPEGAVSVDQQTSGAESPEQGAPDRRDRSRAVTNFMQRHLRDQFKTGRPRTQKDALADASRRASSTAKATSVKTPEDHPARATRRELDRIRQQRRSKQTLTAVLTQRRDKAEGFYRQGIKQLEEGKALAAAASLKLAVSFDPENALYRTKYDSAAEASRDISAENYFKRALFEESVGRYETAVVYFQQAADTCPKDTYLVRAADAMRSTGELIKSREYATKAVQVAPESPDARLALARVLLAAGQKKNARREADIAKKLAPGNPEVKELIKQIKRS